MGRAIFLPKQGMSGTEIELGERIEARAVSREADDLAEVVDSGGKSFPVLAGYSELLDLAIFPDDRLKLELLGSLAIQVRRSVLRKSDHVASIVDLVDRTVVALDAVLVYEHRELLNHAILPSERTTNMRHV